ncbi:MAG: serine/threonine protein kinase, partial [Chloroflexota bacterium]
MTIQPGQVLNNRYRIDRQLGQGGFGQVYLAWDQNLDEWIAIKESLDVSPANERQFRSEAKLLFRLQHPNLPRVHDYFAVPGQGLYLAMDYIDGESLQSKMDRSGGPLALEQVQEWIGPICDALDYLHRQQPPVIHRDIKPANVIVRSDGCPFLVDFGISKLFDPNRPTTVGARALTPGYSPPEQYGMAATDARSDIYSLGATVYHLLTGQAPPAALDVLAGVVKRCEPPHLLNPGLPLPCSQAIMQALQPNREERFSSAGAFKQALLRWRPVVVQPVEQPAQVAPDAFPRTQVSAPAPPAPAAPAAQPAVLPAQPPYAPPGGSSFPLVPPANTPATAVAPSSGPRPSGPPGAVRPGGVAYGGRPPGGPQPAARSWNGPDSAPLPAGGRVFPLRGLRMWLALGAAAGLTLLLGGAVLALAAL